MSKSQKKILYRIIISAVLTVTGIVLNHFEVSKYICLPIFILSVLTVGYDVLFKAFNNIFHGHLLDENFLMMIGSIGAFALGDYAEGTFIVLLYQIGELFQSIAVGKSRKSIGELMDIRPDTVNALRNGKITEVFPEEVEIGETIVIYAGERVAIDSVVTSGNSEIDTSSLTGESMLTPVAVSDSLLSGCVNISGTLHAKTVKTAGDSTASKILEMVENASTRKSKAENFVTKFAKYYTPIVVALAVLLCAVPTFIWGDFTVWFYRAIMFLVISCPCALVISVPLAFFGAIGGASKSGILVKGSNYLETMAKADTVVFDKTGTLTHGKFSITKTCSVDDDTDLLKLAAICENESHHPIALSIRNAAEITEQLKLSGDYTTINGKGVGCTYDGKKLYAGNKKLFDELGITVPAVNETGTIIYVSYDNEYKGYIVINDTVKETTKEALKQLKQIGIKKTVMLTGDKTEIANKIGNDVGIDEVRAELLPDGKVECLEKIINSAKGKVIYVGDGINDAPVLARADVGIAMGSLGSDAAIEAADTVIMNDDLLLLAKAIKISRKALRISTQNIVFALLVKFSQLILCTVGLSNIYMAVFADVGVMIIAIINSMRTLISNK